MPVSTIAFGTDYGTIELDADEPPVSVAVDDEAMQQIAELSGGQFYTAASETELQRSTPSSASRSATRCARSTRAGRGSIGRRAAARRRASARAIGLRPAVTCPTRVLRRGDVAACW